VIRSCAFAASELFRQLQDQAELRNVYNDPELSRQMPGVAATINQRQIRLQELADECIQRHGEEVLDGEVNRKILQQALRKANLTVTDDDLQAEVSRAADAYGYVNVDGSPDVDSWLKHVTSEGGERRHGRPLSLGCRLALGRPEDSGRRIRYRSPRMTCRRV
jgi:hypothetical protein